MTKTPPLATGNSKLDGQLRLESCSPEALVDALVDARGKEGASRILREASKLLAGPVVGDANDAKVVSPDDKRNTSASDFDDGKNHQDASNENERLLGKSLLSEPIETSFLSPRMGKFSLQLYENGLLAKITEC